MRSQSTRRLVERSMLRRAICTRCCESREHTPRGPHSERSKSHFRRQQRLARQAVYYFFFSTLHSTRTDVSPSFLLLFFLFTFTIDRSRDDSRLSTRGLVENLDSDRFFSSKNQRPTSTLVTRVNCGCSRINHVYTSTIMSRPIMSRSYWPFSHYLLFFNSEPLLHRYFWQ